MHFGGRFARAKPVFSRITNREMIAAVQGNAKFKRRLLLGGFPYCFLGQKTVCPRLDRPEVPGPTRHPLRATLCLVIYAWFCLFAFFFLI